MSTTEQIAGAQLLVLSVEEIKARFDANEIVLIDVRAPNEYVSEHIAGALLYPMAFFDPAKLPDQSVKPIVFHCGSGKRSRMIAELCAGAGITTLAHMEGGMAAWKAAGLPYVMVNPSTGAFEEVPGRN